MTRHLLPSILSLAMLSVSVPCIAQNGTQTPPAETTGTPAVPGQQPVWLLQNAREIRTSQPPSHPYVGFNGKEVMLFEGNRLVGVDPQSSATRWSSEDLMAVRKVVETPSSVVTIGNHVVAVSKADGKTQWMTPLNCPNSNECNSDVLSIDGTTALIGGMGRPFNMLRALDLNTGAWLWNTWAPTCPLVKATLFKDRVGVVCTAATPGSTNPPAIQVYELRNRRLLAQAIAIDPAFVPSDGWFSSKLSFVLGMTGGVKKLQAYANADGKLVKTFVVADQPGVAGPGFFVAPVSGRFVPWQVTNKGLEFWGLEPSTGAVQWNKAVPGATVLGQSGSTALLNVSYEAASSIIGLDLETGERVFETTVPIRSPALVTDSDRIVLSAQGSSAIIGVTLATGRVDVIGQLPAPAGPLTPASLYLTLSEGAATVRAGEQVLLLQKVDLESGLQQFAQALDAGNEPEALQILEPLRPFESLSKDISDAARQLARFRILNADLLIRRKDCQTGLSQAIGAISESRKFGPDDWADVGPRLFRVVTLAHYLCPDTSARSDFLFEVLTKIQSNYKSMGKPEQLALITIMITDDLESTEYKTAASETLAELQANPELRSAFEKLPAYEAVRLLEVDRSLAAARQSVRDGDLSGAADILHGMATNPAAVRLFGADNPDWMDAQSAYLLPSDLLPSRVPDIIKNLENTARKSRSKALQAVQEEVCLSSCDAAAEFCPNGCATKETCWAARSECRDVCARKKKAWAPPEYTTSPLSPLFYKCR